jgi:hypothetical protein
VAVEA